MQSKECPFSMISICGFPQVQPTLFKEEPTLLKQNKNDKNKRRDMFLGGGWAGL